MPQHDRVLSRRRDGRLEAELQPALNLFGVFLKIPCRVVWGNPFDNSRLFDKSARGSDIGVGNQGGRLELPLHRFRDRYGAAGIAARRRDCSRRAAGVRSTGSPHSAPRQVRPKDELIDAIWQGRIVSEATLSSAHQRGAARARRQRQRPEPHSHALQARVSFCRRRRRGHFRAGCARDRARSPSTGRSPRCGCTRAGRRTAAAPRRAIVCGSTVPEREARPGPGARCGRSQRRRYRPAGVFRSRIGCRRGACNIARRPRGSRRARRERDGAERAAGGTKPAVRRCADRRRVIAGHRRVAAVVALPFDHSVHERSHCARQRGRTGGGPAQRAAAVDRRPPLHQSQRRCEAGLPGRRDHRQPHQRPCARVARHRHRLPRHRVHLQRPGRGRRGRSAASWGCAICSRAAWFSRENACA